MLIEIMFMLIGHIAGAVSIFLIRASRLAPGYLAAYRLFLSVLIFMPLFLRDARKLRASMNVHWGNLALHLLRYSLLPGVMLGLHFIFWNTAASMTLAANASLIVNMVPLFMPVIIFFMTSERPVWQEILATVIALGGVLLLTLGDLSLGREHLLGDLYSFISMLFLAVYLALSRKNKALPFWYYTGGVYLFGGITAFIISSIRGMPLWTDRGLVELLPVLGLTLVPTLLGHNLINRAMRRIPSQLVSVGLLSQVLWVGIFAWLLYGELPRRAFYPAIGLIGLGMGIIVFIHYKNKMEDANATGLS